MKQIKIGTLPSGRRFEMIIIDGRPKGFREVKSKTAKAYLHGITDSDYLHSCVVDDLNKICTELERQINVI